MYFHAKGQFLDLSGRMGYTVHIGQRIQSQITFQDVLQLDYKNTKTGTFHSFFLSNRDKKCSHDNYDQCMYNTLRKVMQKETSQNCTVPWIFDNGNICKKFSDIRKAFKISWTRITNQQKDCLSPCHATLVNVGAKNKFKQYDQDFARMDVYFASHVMQSKEHYHYTALKMLAQIGGYVGLFRLSLFLLELFQCNKYRQDDKIMAIVRKKISRTANNEKSTHEILADEQLINLSNFALDTL